MPFQITFHPSGRGKAQCPPNPAYPDGIDLDTGSKPSCRAELPYPAPECGTWLARCALCGVAVACTAAGRPDDPRSITLPCDVMGVLEQTRK